MNNTQLAISLLVQLAAKTLETTTLLKTAHAENREPTDAELAAMLATADQAYKELGDAIVRAKAEGR